MASWIDVFSLFVTTLLFLGVVLSVVYATRSIKARVQSTKTSLEHRGITLSREGISLKTTGRFDREDYVDATQRGLVKALSAATVGPESHQHAFLPETRPSPTSDDDNARTKHTVFGLAMHRSHSGGHGEESESER